MDQTDLHKAALAGNAERVKELLKKAQTQTPKMKKAGRRYTRRRIRAMLML
jgi:hypothetical protein